jgi:dihydropteroate synthase
MDILSEEFVEKTWQKVAEFTPERANKEMQAMGKNQPELLAPAGDWASLRAAVANGADIVRVHDVKETRRCVDLVDRVVG